MISPPWMQTAIAQMGTKEIPGAANNLKIMGWANRVTARVLGISYQADSIPWCGLLVAYCMAEAGCKPPAIAIRAKSWAGFGKGLSAPVYGCVLVFDRKGGGHVGFYLGETNAHYRVLGGNQGDKVSEIWLDKAACIAHRWPNEFPIPLTGRKKLKADGAPVGGSLA